MVIHPLRGRGVWGRLRLHVDGSIGIAAVAQADMSFSQYQIAVGRVISILADGRANVIVKAV